MNHSGDPTRLLTPDPAATTLQADATSATLAAMRTSPGEASQSTGVQLRVGRYRVLGLIGEGAMGSVYLAEQEKPQRRVALKLIRSAGLRPDLLARFELEAEILGRLQHVGIAQVIEAGSVETDGRAQPYIVMEYVDGGPLLEHAKPLDQRARIALLLSLCEAVEHAHQRGVVHRDLKPANVLVDRGGQPKILDFGVARVSDAEGAGDSDLTRAGSLIGTLGYMSPEQAGGETDRVDTRSDVYALGIIGFELLTGRRPYELGGKSLVEIVRVIREQPPLRLSDCGVGRAGSDLDLIIDKVLAKEPDQRYPSAGAFADDLRRMLSSQPVRARAPTRWYTFTRFARRHKAMMVAGALVLAAMVSAAAVSASFALQARAQAAEAQAALLTLGRMLAGADPARAGGAGVTVREMLLRSVEELDRGARLNVASDAKVRALLGQALHGLGDSLRALRQVEAARAVESSDAEGAIELQLMHAVLLSEVGRLHEAVALGRDLVQRSTRLRGPDAVSTLQARVNLAGDLHTMGETGEAEATLRDVIDRLEAGLAAGDPELVRNHLPAAERDLVQQEAPLLAFAYLTLGQVLRENERIDEAELSLRFAQRLAERLLGQDATLAGQARNSLANLLADDGRRVEALALTREQLDRYRRTHGPDHVATLNGENNLGLLLQRLGELDAALAMLESVVERGRRTLGTDAPMVITAESNLATLYWIFGRREEARALIEQAQAKALQAFGENDDSTHLATLNLAVLLAELGENERAEGYFRQALDGTVRRFGAAHTRSVQARSELAAFLRDAGKYPESRDEFERALGDAREFLGREHPQVYYTMYQFGGLLQRQKEWDAALALSQELVDSADRVLPPADPFRLLAPMRHAMSLMGLGRLDEARRWMDESWQRLEAIGPQATGWKAVVAEQYAALARAEGDVIGARNWEREYARLIGQPVDE